MERVINKNSRILLIILIVGINWYKFADVKKNNVLNINPTLINSKYAFLFSFQYNFTQNWYLKQQDSSGLAILAVYFLAFKAIFLFPAIESEMVALGGLQITKHCRLFM